MQKMDAPEAPVIIFDWDDTLLPTHSGGFGLTAASDGDRQALAKLLTATLKAARSLARVVLITLSKSPWVSISASIYIPSLDVDQLLRDLNIQVYYAGPHLKQLCVQKKQQWCVDLDCRDGAWHGITVSTEAGNLIVSGVEDESEAALWNEARSSPAEGEFSDLIEAGTKIIAVNAVGDAPKDFPRSIQMRLQVETVLRITFEGRYMDRVGPSADAKQQRMTAALEQFYAGAEPNTTWNAISVGDSEAERRAMLGAMQAHVNSEAQRQRGNNIDGDCLEIDRLQPKGLQPKPRAGYCKIVRFRSHPSMNQLSDQLRALLVWMPRLVAYSDDFEHNMFDLAELPGDRPRPSSRISMLRRCS